MTLSETIFQIGTANVASLVALALKRKRAASGLSLAQVSARLNSPSRNTYARYERGESVPTVSKLAELLAAVDPEHELVLRESDPE